MLDQHVGVGAFEVRIEAADKRRVSQGPQRVDLASEVVERLLVLGLIGPDHLCDPQRKQRRVPDQADLVAVAAADRLQHDPPGVNLVPLAKIPARVLAHAPKGRRIALSASIDA